MHCQYSPDLVARMSMVCRKNCNVVIYCLFTVKFLRYIISKSGKIGKIRSYSSAEASPHNTFSRVFIALICYRTESKCFVVKCARKV